MSATALITEARAQRADSPRGDLFCIMRELADALESALAAIKEHDDGLISDCYFITDGMAEAKEQTS